MGDGFVEKVLESCAVYCKCQGRDIMECEVFSFLNYIVDSCGVDEQQIAVSTQEVLLQSALKYRMCSERIVKLCADYIDFLNESVMKEYLYSDSSEICDNAMTCIAAFLSDDSFDELSRLLRSESTSMSVRDKAMHILSFSEERRCIDILREFAPKGFVLIPAGFFQFGSDNSLDEHYGKTVWLPSYYISKYPITMSAYRKGDLTLIDDKDSVPCHSVTWFDAYHYAESNGLSLPTEAQWEKAMRGCDGREYPWGNDFDSDRVNSFESGREAFTSVGFFESTGCSPYGVVDCVGNCWEWTGSLYDKYYAEKFLYGVNEETLGDRVLRGGAFDFDRYGVTCTNRYRCNPQNGWDTHGFRVAKTL